MQNPVKEGIGKLREAIAQISEANRLHLHGGGRKPHGAAEDPERRLQRLQESLDDLVALSDSRKLRHDLNFTVLVYSL